MALRQSIYKPFLKVTSVHVRIDTFKRITSGSFNFQPKGNFLISLFDPQIILENDLLHRLILHKL